MLREKPEKRRVTQVFFEICAMAQVFSIDFRHGQTVPPKVPGEFEESDILFAYLIQNANRAESFVGKPDDFASRTAKLALEWLYPSRGGVEVLLKKPFENVHEHDFQQLQFRAIAKRLPGR